MLPEKVKIVEVGPRDGLQNEKIFVSTDDKIDLIERLIDAGLSVIESTSFVSPQKVPQMADCQEIMFRLPEKKGVRFPVLVPNMRGFENAEKTGVKEIAVFAAASETFSQKNINCSIAQSLQRFEQVIKSAHNAGIAVRGYVSCIVGCPYEGFIAAQKVAEVAAALYENGCYEISLGDTLGVGTPNLIGDVIDACTGKIPVNNLAGHYHNTYGMAIVNIYQSLLMGVSVFDSSVGGLGGCPYAPGATGNVATEDVVYLLHGLGIQTGIDLEKIVRIGAWINKKLQKPVASAVTRAKSAQDRCV